MGYASGAGDMPALRLVAMMARHLPDMRDHGKHLCAKGKKTLGALAVQRSIKVPSTYWLAPGEWDIIFYYLKGGGFDVERGFAFHGVPVKKFNA